jgi:hypothetical protein
MIDLPDPLYGWSPERSKQSRQPASTRCTRSFRKDAGRRQKAEKVRLMPRLVLLRHGQSQWNLENRFTGWWDVDLSEKGDRGGGRGRRADEPRASFDFDSASPASRPAPSRRSHLALARRWTGYGSR